MGMKIIETIKLSWWEDICRHENKCECSEWLYVTVPDYRTYLKGYDWLRHERKSKLIFVEGVKNDDTYTGAYRFKFLCEQEHLLFLLRWT